MSPTDQPAASAPPAPGGPAAAAAPIQHATLIAFCFGIAVAWSGGNIGPVVRPISAEFAVSLTTVGLLAGTVFFAGITIAQLIAAPVSERAGVTGAMRLACVLAIVGNAIFALSPEFAGLAVGRILAGVALGLTFVVGPVFARAAGGVRLMGLFGGATSLGIASALALDHHLDDHGDEGEDGHRDRRAADHDRADHDDDVERRHRRRRREHRRRVRGLRRADREPELLRQPAAGRVARPQR